MTVPDGVVGRIRLGPQEDAVLREAGADAAQRALRIPHVVDAVERADEREFSVAGQLARGLGSPLDVEQPALGDTRRARKIERAL
jgi:hypothetical protein